MKRNDRLGETMGMVIGWTLLIVLIGGAQPGNALTPRHPFHTLWGFASWKDVPDRDAGGRAAFRSSLANAPEIRPEPAFTQPILPSATCHAARGFLTPEELEKLLRYKAAERMLRRLSAASKLLLTPRTLEIEPFSQTQAAIFEARGAFAKAPRENFVQVQTPLTPKQHLQKLETLRL